MPNNHVAGFRMSYSSVEMAFVRECLVIYFEGRQFLSAFII